PKPNELVDAYAKEMARARDFVEQRKLAPIPEAPLGVIPTPAFMRPVIPYAAYDSPGAYSRNRTGWFYVTVPDSRLPSAQQELFFQRVDLLWRAMRILLDVGLHTRGMTREQAVDQMVHELHVERGNAEAEVRRYCAWPAYQLCYAVGRRELLRLRDDFRKA